MKTLASIFLIASVGCFVQPAPPPAAPGPAPTQPEEQGPEPAGSDEGGGEQAAQVGPTGDLNDYDGPISCSTTEDLTIEDVDLDLGGDSIQVIGSCDIYITNSRIAATRGALVISGSGNIVVRNSEILGNPAASIMGSGNVDLTNSYIRGNLAIMGSGNVNISGNVIEGQTSVVGTGHINDGGGNEFR